MLFQVDFFVAQKQLRKEHNLEYRFRRWLVDRDDPYSMLSLDRFLTYIVNRKTRRSPGLELEGLGFLIVWKLNNLLLSS